nr:uncharacterized protein At4g02000-like [Malus domestica]
MWVQIHKVPPLSMTAAVAMEIGEKLGKVVWVDKSASRECIGRFLQVRIKFNLQEPLMQGMMVTFSDEGRVWVQLQYEGLRNYCFYYGKLGHVSRVCKTHGLHELHGLGEEDESQNKRGQFPYEGLEARWDLQGSVIHSPSRRSTS